MEAALARSADKAADLLCSPLDFTSTSSAPRGGERLEAKARHGPASIMGGKYPPVSVGEVVMFVADCWYAAGFPDEFGRKLVGRAFLGEPVVLFRTEAGELVALEDRCAHRRLPLSVGRLKGDTVECSYHGLVYDCSGACIKVPGQSDVPRTAQLRRYPVADMHGYSWIWLGDPTCADRATIPDYSRLSLPELGRHRIALHVEANYQLVVDNLLDLSHLPYVHGTTTGNPPVSESASVKTERHGDTVQVKRWAENVEPAPTFVQFGGYHGKVDIWQISQFQPPCYIRVSYGSGPAGTGIPQGEAIWEPGHWGFQVFHGITPESETTTHQFRYILHEKGNADPAAIAEFYRQNDQIINEDRIIFAIQQKALATSGDGASAADVKTSAIIKADGGLIQARSIISAGLQGGRTAAAITLRA